MSWSKIFLTKCVFIRFLNDDDRVAILGIYFLSLSIEPIQDLVSIMHIASFEFLIASATDSLVPWFSVLEQSHSIS